MAIDQERMLSGSVPDVLYDGPVTDPGVLEELQALHGNSVFARSAVRVRQTDLDTGEITQFLEVNFWHGDDEKGIARGGPIHINDTNRGGLSEAAITRLGAEAEQLDIEERKMQRTAFDRRCEQQRGKAAAFAARLQALSEYDNNELIRERVDESLKRQHFFMGLCYLFGHWIRY